MSPGIGPFMKPASTNSRSVMLLDFREEPKRLQVVSAHRHALDDFPTQARHAGARRMNGDLP